VRKHIHCLCYVHFLCGCVDKHITIAYFQFTDLEEEFEEFKQKVELEQAEKEEELTQLRGLLKAMEQQSKHTGNNGAQLP
jgi:hypothetical protein